MSTNDNLLLVELAARIRLSHRARILSFALSRDGSSTAWIFWLHSRRTRPTILGCTYRHETCFQTLLPAELNNIFRLDMPTRMANILGLHDSRDRYTFLGSTAPVICPRNNLKRDSRYGLMWVIPHGRRCLQKQNVCALSAATTTSFAPTVKSKRFFSQMSSLY